MPFQMQVLPEHKLVLVTARGKINFDSSVGAMRELAQRPDFSSSFSVLADFRGVKYTPSFSDLWRFDSLGRSRRSALPTRIVWVSWSRAGCT